MSRLNIFGWVVMTAGLAVWAYGYFVPGHVALINWVSWTPHWISEFIPNLESEIGLLVMIVAVIPAYWPKAAV